MTRLPEPGPGRPHHRTYSEERPAVQAAESEGSLLELVFLCLLLPALVFAWTLLGGGS